MLTLVAGRIDGTDDKPQLQPLDTLELDLIREGRLIGRLARLRDLLPGRYAFGITGRGPRGGRLPLGDYVLRVTGSPTGGGEPTVRELADTHPVRRAIVPSAVRVTRGIR